MNTESKATASETARQVEALVRDRQQLKAAGADMSSVEQQIKPYKTIYVRAGATYGGNYSGMVKWFNEQAGDAFYFAVLGLAISEGHLVGGN